MQKLIGEMVNTFLSDQQINKEAGTPLEDQVGTEMNPAVVDVVDMEDVVGTVDVVNVVGVVIKMVDTIPRIFISEKQSVRTTHATIVVEQIIGQETANNPHNTRNAPSTLLVLNHRPNQTNSKLRIRFNKTKTKVRWFRQSQQL